MMTHDRAEILFLVAAVLTAAAGCGDGPSLETRTFRLQHVEPHQAERIIRPYVYAEREGAPGRVSTFDDGLTVRETTENLQRIETALEEADRPSPSIRLRFQLIRADGGGEPDPRIEHVRSVLEDLFRYEGYRLLEEVQTTGTEGAYLEQKLQIEAMSYTIEGELDNVEVGPGSGEGAVELAVSLVRGAGNGTAFSTTVSLPLGQTVVLGSSRPEAEGSAIILTVTPDVVERDTAAAGGG